jgi:hypothetical protein
VTKFDQVVVPSSEPTLLQPSPVMQPEPVKYDRGDIVFSGNTFGECVMINVGSPNCIGAGGSIGLSEREYVLIICHQ